MEYEHRIIMQRKSSAIKVLREYKLSHIPFTRVMPEAPDFLAFPEVDAILSQPKNNIAPVILGVHNLRSVVLKLPWIMHFWRTEINTKLVNHFREQESLYRGHGNHSDVDVAMEDISSGSSELANTHVADGGVAGQNISLATTVFICSTCSTVANEMDMMDCDSPAVPIPLFYPELFGHRCLTRSRPHYGFGPENSEEAHVDPFVKLDGQRRYRTKWSCEQLRIDKQIGRMVEDIVTACGLDPARATAEDMDKCRAKLMCMRCMVKFRRTVSNDKRPQAFGWRRAVSGSVVT